MVLLFTIMGVGVVSQRYDGQSGDKSDSGTDEFFTFFKIRNATTGVSVYIQNFLPFTTTSSIVPADTLMQDTQYDFEVDYSNRIDRFDNIDSVDTTQGFDVRVEATVTTGSSTSMPEPGSLWLLGTALVGFGVFRRQRTRAQRKPAYPLPRRVVKSSAYTLSVLRTEVTQNCLCWVFKMLPESPC